jgi:nucleoside-diphosphate kinase
MEEPTLVIVKPDGLSKSLTGNILTKLSETKLVIVGAKMKQVTRELAEEHYKQLHDKPFFEEIVQYLMGEFHTKRTMALVYYGDNAIKRVREVCGATNPEEAAPGSIRGSFGRITTKGVYENVIHASSDTKEAEREIKLWFSPEEIVVDNLYPTKETTRSYKARVWA